MSHTHFLYHIVFATKDRMPLIGECEAELYKYLSGIVRNHGGVLLAVGGMPDHVHLLVRLGPCDFPAFMRELKASSSRWAKQHQPKFSWQRRYGAFTVSESVEDKVQRYILHQKSHHGKQSFEDEYKALLTRHRVQFDEKYLWD
jgi:REP element-mobilizing transposase RayT